jgi:hypothetical protein
LKLSVLAVATATLIVASPVAFAQGVSSNAPGHKTKNYKGSPGASYWAPGHKMQRHERSKVSGPGASGYAPGRSTTGYGSKY